MPRPLPSLTPLPPQRRREPFDHLDWLFELKLDGFRALAYVERGQGRLVSRNGNIFKRFAPLAAEIAGALRGVRNAILDGEVVCLDGAGRPLFTALLYRRAEPYFYAFDLLALDGADLRDAPLRERKRRLRRLLGHRRGRVRYLDHVVGHGVDLFRLICTEDLEGIVAKHARGTYDPTATTWWKIKNVAVVTE